MQWSVRPRCGAGLFLCADSSMEETPKLQRTPPRHALAAGQTLPRPTLTSEEEDHTWIVRPEALRHNTLRCMPYTGQLAPSLAPKKPPMEEGREAKAWGAGQNVPPEERPGRSVHSVFMRSVGGGRVGITIPNLWVKEIQTQSQFMACPEYSYCNESPPSLQAMLSASCFIGSFTSPVGVCGFGSHFQASLTLDYGRGFALGIRARRRCRCQTHCGLPTHSCCSSIEPPAQPSTPPPPNALPTWGL